MLMDALLEAVLEALQFLFWVLPHLCNLAVFILTPVVSLSVLGWLALFKGWRHVAGTLREKWLQWGWDREFVNTGNIGMFTSIFGAGAHTVLALGTVLNLFIVYFIATVVYQLLIVH
jgi:hypothetical protein